MAKPKTLSSAGAGSPVKVMTQPRACGGVEACCSCMAHPSRSPRLHRATRGHARGDGMLPYPEPPPPQPHALQPAKHAKELLPCVAAAAGHLPWTPQYAGKTVGWTAVASADLKPGHLVYHERAYLLVPRAS